MKTFGHHFLALPMYGALAMIGPGSALAQSNPSEVLIQRLEALQKELDKLKSELTEVRASQEKSDEKAANTATQAQSVRAELAALSATSALLKAQSATTFTGYGELNYNRYTKNGSANQFNVRRIVLGVNHRFNEKTKLVTEIEFENGVTSATDRGEVAIEQAYIEHQFTEKFSLRGGLFLVPLGFLNERHEPFSFYGVERNFVETAIIPTTWREGGLMGVGNFDNGFTVKGGIATGWDLGKWDSKSTDSKQSPLGSIHQEGSLAKARDLNIFGAVEWRGFPGLMLGTGIFSGKAGHRSLINGFGLPIQANPRVTLWDVRARFNIGKLDLSALYSKGTISQTSALNVAFAGDVAPIPSSFEGGYLQAAYNVWSNGDQKLVPFARLERFNTGKGFNLPVGLGRSDDAPESVSTIGANYYLTPTVVVKADYQNFKVNPLMNRLNLGLGYSF
jgi:Phosphate-selective porin O and P